MNSVIPKRYTIAELLETKNQLRVGFTDEDRKTWQFFCRVRSILNKLTPQKFITLMRQMKTLPIDTTERLLGVVELIYEKAVNEPLFSMIYALMCRELALMGVSSSADNKKEFINFRKLLVTLCQLEFEKDYCEEDRRKLKEIYDCMSKLGSPKNKLEMEEEERRIQMKFATSLKFIGELFNQQMLTANIMMRCLQNLIDKRDEMRIEGLCVLLKTVGRELELKEMNLEPIFSTMKDIADKKIGNVSNKVRFRLMDVIDLRNRNWVPRKPKTKPKKKRGFSSNTDQNDSDDDDCETVPYLTYPQIRAKLMDFIWAKQPGFASEKFDGVYKWISIYVGKKRVKEKEFISVLAMVVFKRCIVDGKLDVDRLLALKPLLECYVEGKLDFQLECINAVRIIVINLRHPYRILENIIFKLEHYSVISENTLVTFCKKEGIAEDTIDILFEPQMKKDSSSDSE